MRSVCSNKEQMLHQISVISFAAYDMLLYLDTHPDDGKALSFYQEQCSIRNQLLSDYACQFGPLTMDLACKSPSDSWDWVMQPWPWENCQNCQNCQKGGMR